MAGTLEEILSGLLVADNAVIQQSTQKLKSLYKEQSFVSGLCQVLGTSQNAQVRQYAAILLRKKILKSKQWAALQGDIAPTIRENILQLLLQEPEKIVRVAIAQVVAAAAKHDLPNNAWPQLFVFISQHVKSDVPQHREIGMYLLYSVASSAAEQLKPHLTDMVALVSGVLTDQQSSLAPFYAIKTLSEVVFYVGDDALKPVQQIVPQILQVIKNLILVDQEKACEAFEVFDEMLECEVVIITPHLKSTVLFCLEIAANNTLEDGIRVKAMSFICSLTRLRKKQILKNQLVLPILNVMFPVMCETYDDEDDDDEDDVESQRPSQIASQVLDTMAMHLPPEKFIPPVMSMVEPSLQDEKPERRKAAFIAMAVVAEGCADFLTNNHIQAVLQCVCKGLSDPDQHVRNGALFAIGQFSEHLQPDISKYASDVLPLLFQYLLQVSQEGDKNSHGLTRSYYALEMFCQNLGKDIQPYLPQLMEHLMTVLKTSTTLRPKELAISAIGATASAAESLICPYFQEIINQFREYLVVTEGNEEMFKLQIQTIDTLGVLARCVGAEMFQPLTKESIQFGLNLLNTAEDPDQRRCIYGLFAALSTLLKAHIGEYLQTMMHFMLLSLRSAEGVKAHIKEESSFLFDDAEFDDEVDIEAEEAEAEGDTSDIAGISVENAYMEEKEDTAVAMGEIAVNAGAAFLPYLEESYQELLALLDYPASRVKKGTVSALGQFCICVHEVNKIPSSGDNGPSQVALCAMLNTLVPRFLSIIADDDDREVVMATVDVIHDLLEKVGQPVLQVPDATDQILTKMKLIFIHKVACQEAEEEDDEDEQAEFDGMLIESAGDVIPVMAKLIGGEHFLGFLGGFLPDLLKRMRQTSSTAEKSFAVGTLGETIEAVGPAVSMYADTLYPVFMKMVREQDDEVRSNSVYSLGVLAANCGQKIQGKIPEVLKVLFEILNKEKNTRVIDNVCAAVCRMIMAGHKSVPLDVVVPVVIKCLPLKEDQEENMTVYKCLTQLYTAGNTQVVAAIPDILKAAAGCLGTDKFKPECEKLVVDFVKDVAQKYPTDFTNLRGSLNPDQASKLDICLAAVNGHCVNGTS
ncbi:importin-4-like [Mercenaria mercenaria]|uniref:importin-4-like n=1 Tax=Mercenaria mercenaria TaxID=6596 RepID=UPI00234E815A|nr:importin-4-like [Mercenaria mercenaria]